MANRITGITIEIGGDTTKLDKALRDTNKSLKETQNSLKDVNKLLRLDPKNTELLRQKQELLKKAIDDTKSKIDTEKKALEQLSKGDKTPEVTAQMERLERQIIEDEQALKGLEKQSKSFGSVAVQQLKASGKEMQEFGSKISEIGGKIKGFGDELTKKVTAPIAALGGLALASFKEVDGAMDTLITKTGATGDALEEMEGIVENLATSIPTDFETAANAVGEVATRFNLTGEELQDLSGKFIQFAAINDTDVSSSIDKVQSAMALFGVETESAGDVLDILNKAAQDTGTPVDELAQSLLTSGTALQEMGFGINNAVGFLSQLEKSGVDSGTAMAGLKKALQKATKEGKPLNKALEEMQKQMKGAKTDTEAAQIASELFGSKAGTAISNAVREGRLSFDKLSTSVEDFGDSVENTFESTQDPIDDFTMALNELKSLGADVGKVIGKELNPYIQKLRDLLKDVKNNWDKLSPGMKDAVIKGAAIIAIIAPIISGIGSMIIGIGKLVTAFGTIKIAAAPVIAAISGITATAAPFVVAAGLIVAAVVGIVRHWDEVKAKGIEIKNSITQSWNTLKTNVTNAINALKTNVTNTWNNIRSTVTNTVTNIKNTVTNTFNNLKATVSNVVNNIKSTVTSKFNAVKSAIIDPIESAKQKVTDAINKIKSTINNAKLSLPHFKLPHFKISGGEVPWGIGGLGKKPTISVEWYKKAYDNPVVFNTPTVLPTMSGYKGFGDGNGSEVVMSYNKLKELVGSGATYNIVVNAAPGMDVRQLADAVAQRIQFQTNQSRAVYA